jgi:hypothetical protein
MNHVSALTCLPGNAAPAVSVELDLDPPGSQIRPAHGERVTLEAEDDAVRVRREYAAGDPFAVNFDTDQTTGRTPPVPGLGKRPIDSG